MQRLCLLHIGNKMMARHYSYGIIPLQQREGEWYVFIINREKGFWEFPKGHAEKDEEPLEAAQRELTEETGLKVIRLLDNTPLTIEYSFEYEGKMVEKTVYYYLAEVEGKAALQKEEVQDSQWVALSDAERHVTYPNSKQLCREIVTLL